MQPQPRFELRTGKPIKPFFWISEYERQHIARNGGGAYEIAVWAGLVSLANSRRSPTFKATVCEIAQCSGCKYRKAYDVITWIADIGLLKKSAEYGIDGCTYTLCTICKGSSLPPMHNMQRRSAHRAKVPPAHHADRIQENMISINEALVAKALRSETKNTEAENCGTGNGTGKPFAQQPREIEPTMDEIERAKKSFAERKQNEVVRFVATNSFQGRTTDKLESLAESTAEESLRHICATVYAKGNAQKQPWSAEKRAAVLTSRLQSVITAEAAA